MFRKMNLVEELRYLEWRKKHTCISQVEFSIVPDAIDQHTKVKCFVCGEELVLTDFDCA